jgi:hypothetical protein
LVRLSTISTSSPTATLSISIKPFSALDQQEEMEILSHYSLQTLNASSVLPSSGVLLSSLSMATLA